MAEWLNSTFFNFDNSVFNFMHRLAEKDGAFFTPFFKVVSFFGEGGVFFIIASIIFLLFKKTRKLGITILLALSVGAIFTNVVIKNAVARPRPFNANEEYREFWLFVSGKEQSEFSFPSGHATATMASMMAVFLCCNKKWGWLGFMFAFIMGLSRIYLMVHYTTDVLGGLFIGCVAGVISYYIVKYIYKKIEKYCEKPFCNFVLNADLLELLKNNKK